MIMQYQITGLNIKPVEYMYLATPWCLEKTVFHGPEIAVLRVLNLIIFTKVMHMVIIDVPVLIFFSLKTTHVIKVQVTYMLYKTYLGFQATALRSKAFDFIFKLIII